MAHANHGRVKSVTSSISNDSCTRPVHAEAFTSSLSACDTSASVVAVRPAVVIAIGQIFRSPESHTAAGVNRSAARRVARKCGRAVSNAA